MSLFHPLQSNYCYFREKRLWQKHPIKIIAGLITPDSGSLIPSKHPLKIGYVPEVSPSHILFTPREYLEHMGQICGMGKQELLSRINYLLELFHLEDAQDTRIAHFSKGMRQK